MIYFVVAKDAPTTPSITQKAHQAAVLEFVTQFASIKGLPYGTLQRTRMWSIELKQPGSSATNRLNTEKLADLFAWITYDCVVLVWGNDWVGVQKNTETSRKNTTYYTEKSSS